MNTKLEGDGFGVGFVNIGEGVDDTDKHDEQGDIKVDIWRCVFRVRFEPAIALPRMIDSKSE